MVLLKVLQQSNGYDCGVHVIANAKHSTRHIMLYGSPEGLPTLPDKEIKGFVITHTAQQINMGYER